MSIFLVVYKTQVGHSGKYYKFALEYFSGHLKQSQTTKHVIPLEKLGADEEILLSDYYSSTEPPFQTKSEPASELD